MRLTDAKIKRMNIASRLAYAKGLKQEKILESPIFALAVTDSIIIIP